MEVPRVAVLALVLAGCAGREVRTPEETRARAERYADEMRGRLKRTRVDPRWSPGGDRLAWREGDDFVVADAVAGARGPAYDPARLPKEIGPVETVVPSDDGSYADLESKGAWWRLDLATYGAVKLAPARSDPPAPPPPPARLSASVRDFNVYVKWNDDGVETRVTRDATPEDGFGGRISWSPDGRRFVVFRTRVGERRQVTYIEAAPKGGVHPRTFARSYDKPGDRIATRRPCLFDAVAGREIPIDSALFAEPMPVEPFGMDRVSWRPDGGAFRFGTLKRGFQLARWIEVDAATGKARSLVEEKAETFLAAHKLFAHPLESGELIWMSERDGWNHLYLFGSDGSLVRQLTKGEWVVRGVERVDEKKREVLIRAGGLRPGEDPYHVHWLRVPLDGGPPIRLTEGDGTHEIRVSPNGRWVLDAWSRADLPPRTELRRWADGSFVGLLQEADASSLLAAGWRAPEIVKAAGRDGKTEIWGLIHLPDDFDPSARYPVIESIYAGPQSAHVPKPFQPAPEAKSLAQLGFVVVQIDGMGTSHRSKSFHDVCWKNLADAGLPDRVAWMKEAAKTRPWMDLSRVGIYGGSAGGQNAMGALLHHGDFYRVGVSACGCHDNRVDKLWWNEQWMGYPVGPHYEASSNVTHAAKLRGKLLLLVGELDTNVDPASTMQVVDALIKAGKDFELLVIPGYGHGDGGPYGRKRRWDFFLRHLGSPGS